MMAGPAAAQSLPVTTDSDEARALFGRAVDQFGHFRTFEAEASLERAVEADTTFALAYAVLAVLQHYDERSGAALAERAVGLAERGTPAERAVAEAVRASEVGDAEAALSITDRLMGEHPDSPLPFLLAADIHFFRTGDFERAEAVLRDGLERHPGHNLMRNLLGYALRFQGRMGEATAVFEENVRLHPDEPNPYDSVGNQYLALGRREEAARAFERSIEVDPDFEFGAFFAPRRNKLGYLYLDLGRYDEAERVLAEQVRHRPNDPNAYDSLGEAYLAAGDFARAAGQFERALVLDSTFASARTNLVRTRIAETNAAFGTAFAARDAGALAALYTEDGQLLPAGTPPVEGSEAIAAYWRGAFEAGLSGADLATAEVFVGADGKTATEVGRYRLSAGDAVADEGKYVVVWQSTPEGWRLHRDIWTTDQASE